MGYTSDLSKLVAFKAEAFVYISSEFDRLSIEEQKKRAKKRGK